MNHLMRFALGGVLVSAVSLFAVDSVQAYEPGQMMCRAIVPPGDDSGVGGRCMDGPDKPIGAIGVTNYDDYTEITFGVWNRLREGEEKCNGVARCFAEVGPAPLEQAELPPYETNVIKENFGIPITFINNFICMCEAN